MNGNIFLKEVGENLTAELKQFKDEMLKRPKEQIYEKAYKIMAMQYIYDQLTDYLYHLSDVEIGCLLGQKDILERIYYEWMEEPLIEEEDLNECIKQFVKRTEKEEIYGKTGEHEKFVA